MNDMCMVGQTRGGVMASIGGAIARKNGDEASARVFDQSAAQQNGAAAPAAPAARGTAAQTFAQGRNTQPTGGSSGPRRSMGMNTILSSGSINAAPMDKKTLLGQ